MSDNVETFADGSVEIEYQPVGAGRIRLAARQNGETLETGNYKLNVFGSKTQQGQFLNNVQDSLESRNGVDANAVRREMREWFADMDDRYSEEREAMRELFTPEIQDLIDGTQSVEIRGGETTTWHVEIEFNGRTSELEFTAAEMTAEGGGALEEKVANHFYQIIDVGGEEWRFIREEWQDRAEVTTVVKETANDSIADRTLEFLANGLMPVADRDKLANDTAAAWVDPENEGAHPEAPADAPVVWVQDSALVDALERTGKGLTFKGQLIKVLIGRSELYGGRARRTWAWDKRTTLFPFKPDALGVDPEEFADSDPEPNHGGVEA